MNANRQWMYNRLKDGLLNTEFLNGLEEFIQFASTHPECMDGMNIRCPCSMRRCSNRKFLCVDDVRYHVMKNGFVPNYYRWTAHGECWDDQGTSSVLLSEIIMENDFQTGANGRYHEMVLEGFGLPSQIEFMEAPNVEAQRLYEMLQAASEELWPGCNKHIKLSVVARLMNMKPEHHFSIKCFDQIVEFVKEVPPEDNVLPDNFYKTKNLIEGLGLPVEKINCCRNNCMIYWSGDAELQECKFCQLPRYKRTVSSLTKQVVQKPYKKMYYFPLTPRLQRLYASDATTPHMRWHAEHEYEEGVMHHPSDSPAWKHFNACYPLFGSEIRNVMLGLSTNEFQPFGQSGQQYSSWPIILTPYNLPPWLCMKSEYMFLTVIVPSPNNSKFKIDIFLQPLIEELKQLWNMGVETYDVDKKQNFLMRVALLWTISDFPAYAMLSGWSTAGRLACPYCMDNTNAFTLPRGGKQCWFDNHRKFLNHNHSWRKNKSWFRKNKVVTEHAPLVRTGEEILHEIESLGLMRVTDPGSDVVNAVISKTCGWRKHSIFWDLPYWSSLLIRHNLDVMHIEKNFFDNLFNTIMNIEGKTKDNAKAREDMREICRWPELEINAETGRYPKAIYALDKPAKQVICEWMKGLRFPDGYVSNMARCVDMNKYRLFGMKSHDCHIFMQRLLPIAFRELLPMRVWEAITELSIFCKQLMSTILREEDMQRLEEDIPVILCKLERIFPPGFFDLMEHLPIHLAYEARIGGPVQYRWMYPYER
ncbi:uncharacterized protein LOC110624220 [Manihot esculenta]|uniref:uncharacterized protein LOC110624220 n=1 Tax=Manihot esculenta TaxID=3983 RepID=UPI000B5D1D19|nr:uncharacterized protein LOC110624220 [Manihot esculenta]